jgi:hypothetical protein
MVARRALLGTSSSVGHMAVSASGRNLVRLWEVASERILELLSPGRRVIGRPSPLSERG